MPAAPSAPPSRDGQLLGGGTNTVYEFTGSAASEGPAGHSTRTFMGGAELDLSGAREGRDSNLRGGGMTWVFIALAVVVGGGLFTAFALSGGSKAAASDVEDEVSVAEAAVAQDGDAKEEAKAEEPPADEAKAEDPPAEEPKPEDEAAKAQEEPKAEDAPAKADDAPAKADEGDEDEPAEEPAKPAPKPASKPSSSSKPASGGGSGSSTNKGGGTTSTDKPSTTPTKKKRKGKKKSLKSSKPPRDPLKNLPPPP